jgi:hypothetical protein
MKLFQQGMALFLSWALVIAGVPDGYAQAPAQALQQSPQQLQQLVAHRALPRWAGCTNPSGRKLSGSSCGSRDVAGKT